MKNLAIAILAWMLVSSALAQQSEPFSISIEHLDYNTVPALNSYAWGQANGCWLLVGGRTDGLHDHRPPFSFPASDANRDIFVVDPMSGQTWSSSIDVLNTDLSDQLSSNNMEFAQVGDYLYIIGGYGYSNANADHITYPFLAALDVPDLINAIMNNQSIVPHIRQITDQRMAVTGGHLALLNGKYYLVWGHRFDGRYNPHNGPSFTQTYTRKIQSFDIVDDGTNLSIANYQAVYDSLNFRRRDYNLLPQIFPNGEKGFTGFTGVFREDMDLPYFDVVDIRSGSYQVRNHFEQLLSHYHSAVLPIHDSTYNAMHSVFFGGMAMYHYVNNVLTEDSLVPFVKTISQVSRFANDSMIESKLSIEMPDRLGASAEFIPNPNAPYDDHGILRLDDLPDDSAVWVGTVFGGLWCSQDNIFMQFSGNSTSVNDMIKVYVRKGDTGTNSIDIAPDDFIFNVYPNPAADEITIFWALEGFIAQRVEIYTLEGRYLGSFDVSDQHVRDGRLNWEVPSDIKGPIIVNLIGKDEVYSKQIMIK